MCGRFTLNIGKDVLSKQFLLKNLPSLQPRYNIAPTQRILAIREGESAGERLGFSAHWGLVPFWAKDPKIGNKMINARSETAMEKPAFRAAFQKRRCLVPASGFYEWKREGKEKQPFFIYPAEDSEAPWGGPAFPFAGLWETWEDPKDGNLLESVTLLTTRANPRMEAIHHRMPVMLPPDRWDQWLDSEQVLPEDTWKSLSAPIPDEWIALHRVSREVNSPRSDSPSLTEPESSAEPFRPREDEDGQGTLF